MIHFFCKRRTTILGTAFMLPSSITQLSVKEYSELLQQIPQPPRQLYARGNISLIHSAAIAVVGSRAMTPYGKQVCELLVPKLVQAGYTIVSGLATGIDAMAHQLALDYGGTTIAVLAHGLNPRSTFPTEHQAMAERIVQANGLLVSEYDYNVRALRHHFPARNRIIAGLTLGTVVVEARLKSGAMITAKYALHMNREVFAVPGPITSSRSHGVHALIAQGATLVQSANDILAELPDNPIPIGTNGYTDSGTTQEFTTTERCIIDQLQHGCYSAEQLSHSINVSVGELAVYLTDLEISGIIRRNLDYTYEISYR